MQFTTVNVTDRKHSPVGEKKVATLQDLVSIIPDEELDSLLLVNLVWMKDNGYNLQDTPENLIARLSEDGTEDNSGS
jgi:hypothetical protein